MVRKRATRDEPIYIDTSTSETTEQTVKELLEQLYNSVKQTCWDYKKHQETLWLRDQAASVVFIVAGLRNSEVCQGPAKTSGWKWKDKKKVKRIEYTPNSYPLRRKQIRVYPERLVILNVKTVKHGKLRPEIIFPKKGALTPFAEILEMWVKRLDSFGADGETYLFPPAYPNTREAEKNDREKEANPFNFGKAMSTSRIWRIIKDTTRNFPHWYRAVCETLYGMVIFEGSAHMLKDRMGLTTLEATVPYVQSSYKEKEKNAEKL
jgi:hypothetical protein